VNGVGEGSTSTCIVVLYGLEQSKQSDAEVLSGLARDASVTITLIYCLSVILEIYAWSNIRPIGDSNTHLLGQTHSETTFQIPVNLKIQPQVGFMLILKVSALT